jgi:hypothetical protein
MHVVAYWFRLYVRQLCYERNSLVPRASCLIDLTAVSGIWIKCTTHARGRSHVTDFKLLASEF